MVRIIWIWIPTSFYYQNSPAKCESNYKLQIVHKVLLYKHASQEVIESSCVSKLQVLFNIESLINEHWRLWIGKSDPKSIHGNGERVQYHYANFENTADRRWQLSLCCNPKLVRLGNTGCPPRRGIHNHQWKMLLLCKQNWTSGL